MPLRLLLAAALAGCGSDEAPDPQPSQRSQPAPALYRESRREAERFSGAGAVAPGSPGRLEFAATTVDFGEVFQGGEATREVPFRNSAAVPIRILEVRSTCGCAAAVPDADVIPPGGAGRIRVTFRPEDRRGVVHSLVMIRTDHAPYPTVTLTVKGVARPVYVLEPAIVDLGEVPRGAEIVREFRIRDATGKPFEVTALTTSRPDVTAEATAAGPAAEHRIRVTARMGGWSGPFLGTVTVRTDREGGPLPTVMIQGTVRGDVEVAPASLFLGGVRKGGRFAPGTVTVTGRLPFTIEGVETGDPAVRATVRPGELDGTYSVQNPTARDPPPRRFERTVRIRTSVPGPPLVVTVSGVVTEAK